MLDTGKETAHQRSKRNNKEITINSKDKCFSYDSKLKFLRHCSEAFDNSELDSDVVKGRLKKHLLFWEQIGANKFILSVIKEGYKLPFLSTPTESFRSNNHSALENPEFVTSTIRELLRSGSVIEVPFEPLVVNPLGVDTRPSGKQRLILDLRHVNKFLVRDRIKFDDWRDFQQFVRPGGFLFKFDLRKGYHHVDIFPEHQIFLGFSWEMGNKRKFYVFTVLPFGLSSAPSLFTKLLRPLVSTWHGQGVKISVFLDDGACIDYTYECAVQSSKMVQGLLNNTGLVINEEKSEWEPTQKMTWLGIELDTVKNTYRVTEERVSSLILSISKLLNNPFTSARCLSRIAGNVVSMKFVLSNVIRLRTRSIYRCIESQLSWDGKFNILHFPEAHKEVLFWRDNIISLNKRDVIIRHLFKTVIKSDASDHGIGAILYDTVEEKECFRMFSEGEASLSSTWRELEAIRFSLQSFGPKISRKSISWQTDNMTAMYISSSGSNIPSLQSLALDINDLAKLFKIDLEVSWISRRFNVSADFISKLVDTDDWEITTELLGIVSRAWGPFSIDRFASYDNAKCERFNSKYHVPGSEAVDAFTQDWRFENNLWVPPVKDIIRVLTIVKYIQGIRGVLIVPYWRSASFWPLLHNGSVFADFVVDHKIFQDASGLLKLGRYKHSLLGSENYRGGIIALLIDNFRH